MNVGRSSKLTNAIKADDFANAEPGSARHSLLSLLAADDPSTRAQPRLPEITFPKRRLKGEPNTQFGRWEQER